MRLQSKLIILLGLIGAGLLITLAIIKSAQTAQMSRLVEERVQDIDSTLSTIVELHGRPLRQFAYDYSYWDDLIEFVKTPDTAWAQENLVTGLDTFGAQYIWVLGPGGDFLWGHTSSENNVASLFPAPPAPDSTAESWFPHYFCRLGSEVVEIRFAPIQPSADKERETTPQGWFGVGRTWDESTTSELAKLVRAECAWSDYAVEQQVSVDRGEIRLGRELTDRDGQPIIYLSIRQVLPIVAEHAKELRSEIYYFVAAGLLFMVIAAAGVGRWVTRPLSIIEQGLIRRDMRRFSRIDAASAEIRRLADLVREFFSQQKALENEIEARKRIEIVLENARRKALADAAAKGEFLACMSHELRTPLNAVIGMTQVLMDGELTPEQRDTSETIFKAGDSLLAIINDILDFSKIDAGRMVLEKIDFDLEELVEDTLAVYAEKAHAQGLEFTWSLSPSTPCRINGDPTRIRQVLTNLLGNALKFTSTGSVRLKVDVVDQTGDNPRILLSVQDTGCGITPDAQARLFSAFTQAEANTSRKYGGTGLGLAISRRLAELMGGNISLTSRPGQGSVFLLDLPLVRASDESPRHLPVDEVYFVGVKQEDVATLNERFAIREIPVFFLNDLDQLEPMIRDQTSESGRYKVVFLGSALSDSRCLIRSRNLNKHRGVKVLPFGDGWSRDVVPVLGTAMTLPTRIGAILARLTPDDAGTNAHSALHDGQIDHLHILLVEDNPVNQKVACKILERMGCRIDVAANGVEALLIHATVSHDVILMDCQMPEMDGFEATAQIRRREYEERRSRTPIIAMTAQALEGDREKCLAAGMDDYLPKPVRVEVLARLLRTWAPASVS